MTTGTKPLLPMPALLEEFVRTRSAVVQSSQLLAMRPERARETLIAEMEVEMEPLAKLLAMLSREKQKDAEPQEMVETEWAIGPVEELMAREGAAEESKAWMANALGVRAGPSSMQATTDTELMAMSMTPMQGIATAPMIAASPAMMATLEAMMTLIGREASMLAVLRAAMAMLRATLGAASSQALQEPRDALPLAAMLPTAAVVVQM